MALELRRVSVDDWHLLRDVRLRALTDSPDAFGSTLAQASALSDRDWQARAGGGGLILVAIEDGVGVAMGGTFAPADRSTVFVWGMWTDPAARGRTIGGQVLDTLLAWCWDVDRPGLACDEVRLHVTEGNDGARRLYTSRGFEPTGEWEPLREDSPLRIEELQLSC